MLTVANLRRPSLASVNLSLADGECVAVQGPSGAGKSLLLRAIADLDPSEGDVGLDGVKREDMPAPDWRRRVMYAGAEPGWWAETPAPHFPDRDKARALVERLGLSPEILDQPISRLSTGERQRLALARALARNPRVLLLDEPTAALDAKARAMAEALVEQYRSRGLAVIWVTHDPEQSARVARRLLIIDHGRVEEAHPLPISI